MSNLPFGFDKPEDSPGFLLWQTTMIWQRQIKKALEQYNVSHAQFVIIATLMWFEAHGYDTTQSLIVNWSQLDKMTVSKSLKKLVQMGLVNRIEHEVDTRAKSVSLTEKGKKMVRTLVPIVEGIDSTFFSKASDQEQKSLVQILAKLTAVPQMNKKAKFWIGVACKEHVENGVMLGICQFCHGKSAPAKRLSRGDFVIYYSSKIDMAGSDFYQKFTAIGKVIDDEPYQVDMGGGFKPFRRNINYFEAKHIDIKPLVPLLPFIKNKNSWGYVFRYGFLEIDQESFEIIAHHMLGFNPLLQGNR